MSDKPLKIFVDTNVWFSAFYGSENAEKLIKAHIEGKIKAVISQKVLDELVKNIKRKVPKALPHLRQLLEISPPVILKDQAEIRKDLENYVDKKDKRILASAINGKLKVFVTGNIKDFKLKEIKKTYHIEVITPREAGYPNAAFA